MEDDIAKLLEGLPGLDATGTAERLGGLTNRVYRMGDLIVRVPGAGTEEYINRTHEAQAAKAAATAGVGPELLYVDTASGVMVTRFVESATMTPEGFRERTGSPARAAKALRQLHRSGQEFPARFELFTMIDDYLGHLEGKDVALPEGYHDVLLEAQKIRSVLQKNAVPLVPCHCDPLCENFLDTGERMWIVDWEYSGMNDPMWDLGDLSVEGQFDAEQDAELLSAYFDGAPPAKDHARMVVYKAMCDLLWTLWGLLQLANKNPADDFRAYADGRFARCRALMATDEFSRHVRLLSADR